MIGFAIFTGGLTSFFNLDKLGQSEHLSSTILMGKENLFASTQLIFPCFKFLHKSMGLRSLKKFSKNGSVASRFSIQRDASMRSWHSSFLIQYFHTKFTTYIIATGLIIMRSVSEDCHLQFMQLLKILITQLYARLSNSSLHLDNLNRSDQIIQFFPQFSHTFSAHSSIS